jgi:hypothetical protein
MNNSAKILRFGGEGNAHRILEIKSSISKIKRSGNNEQGSSKRKNI